MVKTKGWDTEQKALTPIHGTVCLIRVCQALTNLCVLHVKSFIMLKHQRTPNRLDQKKKKNSSITKYSQNTKCTKQKKEY